MSRLPYRKNYSRTFQLLALGIFVLLSTACADQMSVDALMERARTSVAEGDFKRAAIDLKSVLQRDPENADARLELGLMYLEVDSGAAAEKELRRAAEHGIPEGRVAVPLARAALLQRDYQGIVDEAVSEKAAGRRLDLPPEADAELTALRGHAYMALGRLETAEELYRRALELDPQSADARFGRAQILGHRQELAAMRRELEALLTDHPEFAPGWRRLADLLRHQGNLAAAEEAYTKAIDHSYFNSDALRGRAVTRLALEDLEGARADAAKLVERSDASPEGHYLQGVIHWSEGNLNAAEQAFAEALKRFPNHLPTLYYSGLLYAQTGRMELAEAQLERFIGRAPGSRRGATILAAIRADRGDYDGAKATLAGVMARNPADTTALAILGDAALGSGRVDEGVQYLKRLVAEEADAQNYLKLGLGYLSADRRAEGVEALENAARLDTETGGPDEALVIAHLREREFDRAMAVVERMKASSPGRPLAHNLEGAVYLAMGDRERAEAAFRAALEREPGYRPAAHNLARLLLREGDTAGARGALETVLEEDPDDYKTLMALAGLYFGQGDPERSVNLLRDLVESHPDELGPRLLLSRSYLRAGRAAKAAGILQAVAEEHKEEPVWLREMGGVLLATNRPGQAVATLTQLIRVEPDLAENHFLLARALSESGEVEEAAESVEKALSIDPAHFAARVVHARLLIQRRDFEGAAPEVVDLRAARPNNPEVRELEALLALGQGRGQDAVATYREVVEMEPTSTRTVRYAMLLWEAGQREDALDTLTSWLAEQPGDVRAWLALAEAHHKAGSSGDAREAYRRALEHNEGNAVLLNNLAVLLLEVDPARALEHARQALEAAPGSPAIQDTLGLALLATGEPGQAVKVLRNAVSGAPGSPTIRYHLARALAAAGQEQEAGALLDEILEESTGFPGHQEATALRRRLAGG